MRRMSASAYRPSVSTSRNARLEKASSACAHWTCSRPASVGSAAALRCRDATACPSWEMRSVRAARLTWRASHSERLATGCVCSSADNSAVMASDCCMMSWVFVIGKSSWWVLGDLTGNIGKRVKLWGRCTAFALRKVGLIGLHQRRHLFGGELHAHGGLIALQAMDHDIAAGEGGDGVGDAGVEV